MVLHDEIDDATGHHQTVGTALICFGLGCGLFTGAVARWTPQELGFIDAPSALGICGVLVLVGLGMVFLPPSR